MDDQHHDTAEALTTFDWRDDLFDQRRAEGRAKAESDDRWRRVITRIADELSLCTVTFNGRTVDTSRLRCGQDLLEWAPGDTAFVQTWDIADALRRRLTPEEEGRKFLYEKVVVDRVLTEETIAVNSSHGYMQLLDSRVHRFDPSTRDS